MIELKNDAVEFCFPEVHPKAGCRIDFQRTLRITDDNRDYPLPSKVPRTSERVFSRWSRSEPWIPQVTSNRRRVPGGCCLSARASRHRRTSCE
jgi:hypothetical protein